MKAMHKTLWILAVTVALLVPAIAQAQTVTTLEIHDGTVIYVHENTVVVEMSDGSARVVDVEPDFRFDVDGQKVAANQLVPGTKLKAKVTTTTTPRVVKVTEVKKGTILSIVGQNITIRTPEGTKMFKNIPSDFVFKVHGKDVPINKITKGMQLSAAVVIEEVENVTDQDVEVKAQPPKN